MSGPAPTRLADDTGNSALTLGVDLRRRERALALSSAIHAGILLALVAHMGVVSQTPPAPQPGADEVGAERPRRVLLPPRDLLTPQPPPAARVVPPAPPRVAPPPTAPRDRISIGPLARERAKELILRREDDLTAQPRASADGGEKRAAEPTPAGTPLPQPGDQDSGDQDGARRRGLTLPGDSVARSRVGPGDKGLSAALRDWTARLGTGEGLGLSAGHGRQMGPLYFDPQGADFTVWINHFKNEVYRNWIVPQSVFLGLTGRVELEFTISRSGALSDLRLLRSAGTPALDRAAQNALLGGRFLPLPKDYGPERITMLVTFFYNVGPRSS